MAALAALLRRDMRLTVRVGGGGVGTGILNCVVRSSRFLPCLRQRKGRIGADGQAPLYVSVAVHCDPCLAPARRGPQAEARMIRVPIIDLADSWRAERLNAACGHLHRGHTRARPFRYQIGTKVPETA